ncbi:hypothetical protein QBC38DRAFT_473214 [Podospora fimiseda]|uniref:Uncharacterized protein n=1 Tax=Podospora fimiseda TaxID=252190 RepID=A0AAN7BT67_9PEZI|nr:hypothetical protein QBC38DRAFT_473214 [Podospora fimiseda]
MTGRRTTRRNFEPESSWRVVEAGFNDSFETSVLPDDDAIGADPSQSFASTQPYSQSFGGSQQWSIGGSQDDSLENFVNRAEYDDRVLLRSPFRPSIPKEVRESSRENMASKVRASLKAKEENGLRRRRGSVSASSCEDDSLPPTQHVQEEPSGGVGSRLGTVARYGLVQLLLLSTLGAVFYVATLAFNGNTPSLTKVLSPICRLPQVSSLDLAICSAAPDHEAEEVPKMQSFEMDPFLEIQTDFARTVEQALGRGQFHSKVLGYAEAVKDCEGLSQEDGLEVNEEPLQQFLQYVDAVKSVGQQYWSFEKSLEGAVDYLPHISSTAARELTEDTEEVPTWANQNALANRIYSWFTPTKLSQQQVLDTYAKHLGDVFAKVNDVVSDGRRLLKELDTAGEELEKARSLFQTEQQRSKESKGLDLVAKLWSRFVGSKNLIDQQVEMMDELSQAHSMVRKQVSELTSKIEDTLSRLYALRKSGLVGQEVNRPLEYYVAKLTAQSNKLMEISNRLAKGPSPQVFEF